MMSPAAEFHLDTGTRAVTVGRASVDVPKGFVSSFILIAAMCIWAEQWCV